MDESFHVFLCSADGEEGLDHPWDFTVRLPTRLQLNGDQWWCSLIELTVQTDPSFPLYLCSDVCYDSIAGSRSLPVLSRISQPHTEAANLVFVKVKTSELSSIRLYLIEAITGDFATNVRGCTYCTLRFTKHGFGG